MLSTASSSTSRWCRATRHQVTIQAPHDEKSIRRCLCLTLDCRFWWRYVCCLSCWSFLSRKVWRWAFVDHMSRVSNHPRISVCRLFFNLACLWTILQPTAVTSRGNCELKNAASAPPSPGQSAKKHLQNRNHQRATVSSQTHLVMQSVPLLIYEAFYFYHWTPRIFCQNALDLLSLEKQNPRTSIPKTGDFCQLCLGNNKKKAPKGPKFWMINLRRLSSKIKIL